MEIIDVRVQGRMRVYCERRPSEAVWWQWYRESLPLASRPSPFNVSWPPGILIDRATRDRTRHVHTRIRSEDLVPQFQGESYAQELAKHVEETDSTVAVVVVPFLLFKQYVSQRNAVKT